MQVGFTGSQEGMTKEQVDIVRAILPALNPSMCYHGDCIGADSTFHLLCMEQYLKITIYPCNISKKRAYCQYAEQVMPVQPPLVRNHDIVNLSDLMIACPKTYFEELRSGTWATVRYTRKRNKPLCIIQPSGSVVAENLTDKQRDILISVLGSLPYPSIIALRKEI